MITKKLASDRFLTIAFIALLAGMIISGYLTYSAVTQLQLFQDGLDNKLDAFEVQYSDLLYSYQKLNNNFSDLQSQLANMLFENNRLQSQYNLLKSNYSSLQASHAQFVADYQKLQPVAPFNYLIFTDGDGKYYAENGATTAIDYSGTNATEIAQNCIDALSTSGGKIVFSGIINLDGPLKLQKGASNGLLEISGFGPSTQLIVRQGSDGIHIFGDQAFGYGGPYHVAIKDLVLTTETSREGKFMNKGIYIKNWFDVSIENVLIFYANHSGILIEDSANIRLDNVYVEGCSGTEYGGDEPLRGVGIWLRGSKDSYFHHVYSDTNEFGFMIDANPETDNIPRSVFLTQCEATLSNQKGVDIMYADGVVISDSLIEGSNSHGLSVVDSFRVSIENTIIIGNAGSGVFVTSRNLSTIQSQIVISVCTINSNSQNGIEILAANNNTISQININGCTIINSGTGTRGNSDQPNVWDGVSISNDVVTGGISKYIKITNCFIGNRAGAIQTQRYGIQSFGNSDYIQIFQNNFFQNLEGNYSLSGKNNSIENNIDE